MSITFTPYLSNLTYESALKSFWRKESLRKFLRQSHIRESFLSTWTSEETKREFLNRLFSRLEKSEKGKAVIVKMALSLAEQISFPDLRHWEDSDIKQQEAKRAVIELKACIFKQKEKKQSEKERAIIRAMAQEKQEIFQNNRKNLLSLKQNLENLTLKLGTAEGGYDFESWFYSLLDYFETECRRPYRIKERQIDGSITIEGTTYLVELKFTQNQIGAPDIDTLMAKVESKADNTMGLFISMAGYSSTAIKEASRAKSTLLLFDASHIYLVLSEILSFSDLVKRVRRHASQTGEAYLSTDKFNG